LSHPIAIDDITDYKITCHLCLCVCPRFHGRRKSKPAYCCNRNLPSQLHSMQSNKLLSIIYTMTIFMQRHWTDFVFVWTCILLGMKSVFIGVYPTKLLRGRPKPVEMKR